MKRRSATNKRPDESIVYFTDRALGGHVIVDALRAAGMTVEPLDAHFPPDTQDVDIFPLLAEKGWVLLTKDGKILKRQNERLAPVNAGIAAFFLVSGNITGAEMANAFLQARGAMERLVRNQAKPFAAKVYRDGSVALVEL